jgi:hypothetical protein
MTIASDDPYAALMVHEDFFCAMYSVRQTIPTFADLLVRIIAR